MANEDISTTVADLITAIETDDNEMLRGSLTVLVGGALINLERIATAVEKLQDFSITRVGDVVLGEFGQTLEAAGLTDEEMKTIEALRRGDIKVVVVGGWIDWKPYDGNKTLHRPEIHPWQLVLVRHRDGTETSQAVRADVYDWKYANLRSDIVAYKLVP